MTIGLSIAAVAAFGFGKHVLGFQIVCDASGAMEPTVRPGDCVLTGPVGKLSRGDIVSYQADGPEPSRLGRIVALPEERVTLRDGVFSIAGSPFFHCPPEQGGRISRLEAVEGLPPQEALTRWRQSNSVMRREVWPCGLSHLVYLRDAGEAWGRHAFDVPLGQGAFVVAPDNRDDTEPAVVGGSAVAGRALAVVWAADKSRRFSRL